MCLVDIQLAYPLILFTITVAAVFGASLRNLRIVLVIANWVTYTRPVRGDVLTRKQMQFVKAASTAVPTSASSANISCPMFSPRSV